MDRTLIANTTILDGSGAAPFSGDVLVEGQRIVAVQRGGGLPRDGARVIDGAGATLMPGLIEPHGHVSYPDAPSNSAFTSLQPEEHVLITMRNARTMLDCGYTSVLSGASAKPRLDIVIRNEINAGRIPGPRYLANGPEITVTGGLGDENELHLPHLETPTFAWVADGPDEVRKICRLLVREGTDLFKLNVSGHAGPPDSRTDRAVMIDAEVAAAMEIARASGVRVCAHARSADSVKMCVRHGLGIIYHANFADEEALDLLEANRDWCFVVPALGLTVSGVLRGQRLGLHARASPRARPGTPAGDLRRDDGPDAQARHPRPARRRLRVRVEPARHLRPRSPARSSTCSASRRWRRSSRPPSSAARSWAGRTSSARSSRGSSPTCCSSTAIRSPTSSGCRIAMRSSMIMKDGQPAQVAVTAP